MELLWDVLIILCLLVSVVILLEIVLHWISWRLRVIQRNMIRREKERHARALRRRMNATTRPIPRVLTEEEEYFAYRAHG